MLLNTYYHWTPSLRRPPAIALHSTPVIRAAARALARRRPDLDRRLHAWQVGKFIRDPLPRAQLDPQLYEQFLPARPAFWRPRPLAGSGGGWRRVAARTLRRRLSSVSGLHRQACADSLVAVAASKIRQLTDVSA